MVRGLAAIQELLAVAAPFVPARTILVATSAVRGRRTARTFARGCRPPPATAFPNFDGGGAGLIGRGLVCDPA